MAQARADQDCPSLSRRDFVRSFTSAALTASIPWVGARDAHARVGGPEGPIPSIPTETAVARLYQTLSDEQKATLCFPSDHPLRTRVRNNWKIVEPTIEDLTPEQQSLCLEIFQDLCSEDGFDRFSHAMREDYGGFAKYHIALFGQPDSEQPFEWVLTGRHVTLRADGHRSTGTAFGGPIFYGHASHSFVEDPAHTDNVWWFQGEQANAIFQSLNADQRTQALIDTAESDTARAIRLKGARLGEIGLGVADLDDSQKGMVGDLLTLMVRPFRSPTVEGVWKCLRAAGGIEALRLTYSKARALGDGGVWDIWKLEGPAFSWYFHGSPHVHAWLNVAPQAPASALLS